MKIKLKDFEMNYIKQGENQPLILLHGNGENCHIYDESISLLKQKYCVYALDTRGQGRSKSKVLQYHYQEFAEDLYEFIKTQGIQNPILLGYSDGAIIALLFALNHPNIASNLVLCGLNIFPDGIKKAYLHESEYIAKHASNLQEQKLAELMINEPNISLSALHSLLTPTLLFYGQNDIIEESHQILIAQNIINSQLVILENEDHGSYVYHTVKIANLLFTYCK